MPLFPIGTNPQLVAQDIADGAALQNVGSITVYLSNESNPSSANYTWKLDAGSAVQWPSHMELWAVTGSGTTQLAVSYGASGAALGSVVANISGPVSISGPVDVSGSSVLVTGSVNITNASIPVSGSVNANITNASIPVSGNVNAAITNASIPVTGTVNAVITNAIVPVAGNVNAAITGGSVTITSGSVNIGTISAPVTVGGINTPVRIQGGNTVLASGQLTPTGSLTFNVPAPSAAVGNPPSLRFDYSLTAWTGGAPAVAYITVIDGNGVAMDAWATTIFGGTLVGASNLGGWNRHSFTVPNTGAFPYTVNVSTNAVNPGGRLTYVVSATQVLTTQPVTDVAVAFNGLLQAGIAGGVASAELFLPPSFTPYALHLNYLVNTSWSAAYIEYIDGVPNSQTVQSRLQYPANVIASALTNGADVVKTVSGNGYGGRVTVTAAGTTTLQTVSINRLY